MAELQSSPEPVNTVILDLGATTDLDVPSAEMLSELCDELHGQEVRLVLLHVITPVRQMLELTGVMKKLKPEDIAVSPTEAVVDYLGTRHDDAGIQELMRSGADSLRSLLQTSLATAPPERQAALSDIIVNLGKDIQ
jgi:MFS superfamily sulfate permease-like transporter